MADFVFLHGSFHAAWNWHKVIPILEANGHHCVALDMPGHGNNHQTIHSVSLADCVNRVTDLLQTIDTKVILVAHSRNGMVISQVAEAIPEKIEKLVYLAAYLVPDGKSMMDYAKLDTDSLVYQNIIPKASPKKIERINQLFKQKFSRFLLKLITPKTLRCHYLAKHIYHDALYHDCPPEISELANSLLSSEPNFPGFEPLHLSPERYGQIEKVYIECLQDRAVTLPLQRRMQSDSPCAKVISLDSSHSPFFSMPERLADELMRL